MRTLLLAACAALVVATPALAGGGTKDRVTFSLGAMQYNEAAGTSWFVLRIRNTTRRPIQRANFVCEFVTEDMTPFDPQAIYFDEIPAHGKMQRKVTTDTEAYGASCDFRGGRVADGSGIGDGSFW